MKKVFLNLLSVIGFCVLPLLSFSALAKPTVIIGATIFTSPNDPPIENGVVIFEGTKILKVDSADRLSIPKDVKIIDASGKVVVSAFWNSHVHFTGKLEKVAKLDKVQAEQILVDYFFRWGFTNVVDTGSDLDNSLIIRDRIDENQIKGPRILLAAGGFVPKNGSPYYIKPVKLPEFDDLNNIPQLINNTLDNGGDAIKLFTGSWAAPMKIVVMKAEDVKSATKTAHARDAIVFAHPSDSDGARVAIENSVDILAHVFPAQLKGPWDRTLIKKMVEHNVALIPTLKLFRLELNKEGLPEDIINRIEKVGIEQTRALHSSKGRILFGTDIGYMNDPDTSEEFRLMNKAKMDYNDILKSLTTAPATQYKLGESSGKVASGYDADIVILNTDPRQDVNAFSDVYMTYRGGEAVFSQ